MITVTIDPPGDTRPLIRAAFSSGIPISAFRESLHTGRPVFEQELFGRREFHEVASELERLIHMLQSVGVTFCVYEDGWPITPEVLFNILAEARTEFQPPP